MEKKKNLKVQKEKKITLSKPQQQISKQESHFRLVLKQSGRQKHYTWKIWDLLAHIHGLKDEDSKHPAAEDATYRNFRNQILLIAKACPQQWHRFIISIEGG